MENVQLHLEAKIEIYFEPFNNSSKYYYREIQKKLTNAKGHLKTLRSSEGPSTPKGASACPTGVWLWPLSSGPGGQGLVSWVFPFGVAASIDRYHFVPTNAGLADGADLTLGPGFQPGSQAGPTEEVSTHGYNGVCGHIQTYVALKSCSAFLPLLVLFFVAVIQRTLFTRRLFVVF